MKRILWLLAGLAALFFIWPMGCVTEAYSGVCIRCLQRVSGIDKSFLGIPWYHEEHFTSSGEGLMSPAIFGPAVAAGGPEAYRKIFDSPCEHQIVRTGFCRYGGGAVGCGAYGGAQEYELRLALIRSLDQTYQRIPNRPLAQETYELIDRLYPYAKNGSKRDRSMRSIYEADSLPNEPISILCRGLALIHSEKDWREILGAAKAGNGNVPLLTDRNVLIERLNDSDVIVRRQALNSLVACNEPEAWKAIAAILDNPNDEIASEAAHEILWNKRFDQYDRILAWRYPDDYIYQQDEVFRGLDLSSFVAELTDQDIRTLLSQKKPRVDQLCFIAIGSTNRFEFLEEVLKTLNERPSPDAANAITHLIAGPHPDLFQDEKTHEPVASPWEWLQARNRNLLSKSKPPRHATDRLLRQAMELAGSKEPETWESWRQIFEGWMAEAAAPQWSTAFAEAMYAVDPAKTIKYLSTRLETADDSWGNHSNNVLDSMGILAVPEFLPAIQKFDKWFKARNAENPYYNIDVAYALHRCRQIHRWKLVSNVETGGKFAVLKTDGTYLR